MTPQIRLALAGLADPSHRWFLAPTERQRAGIGLVGVSEPDPDLQEPGFRFDGDVLADHRRLWQSVQPTLVAVSRQPGHRQPGHAEVIIDALRYGADVVAVPPLCETAAELEAIGGASVETGHQVTAAHTLRAQPASRLARELLTDGRLGDLELVSLIVTDDCEPDELRTQIADVFDLLHWLTGCTTGTVTAVGDDHPARASDPPEFAEGYGSLIMLATTTDATTGHDVVCEVRRRSTPAEWPVTIQVGGSTGAVEWDLHSGLLRSALPDTEPRLISCGALDRPEWVLNNLLRKSTPVISTASSLATTRMLLLAEHSAEVGGSVEHWQF